MSVHAVRAIMWNFPLEPPDLASHHVGGLNEHCVLPVVGQCRNLLERLNSSYSLHSPKPQSKLSQEIHLTPMSVNNKHLFSDQFGGTGVEEVADAVEHSSAPVRSRQVVGRPAPLVNHFDTERKRQGTHHLEEFFPQPWPGSDVFEHMPVGKTEVILELPPSACDIIQVILVHMAGAHDEQLVALNRE